MPSAGSPIIRTDISERVNALPARTVVLLQVDNEDLAAVKRQAERKVLTDGTYLRMLLHDALSRAEADAR